MFNFFNKYSFSFIKLKISPFINGLINCFLLVCHYGLLVFINCINSLQESSPSASQSNYHYKHQTTNHKKPTSQSIVFKKMFKRHSLQNTPPQSNFVRIFQFIPNGDASGNGRSNNPTILNLFIDIKIGRIPFHGRT